jgi:threonine dehydrogenase-like Zn-dependent dehydrogenase
MKAIVIHGPSDARYEEVPVKPPQEGEVVIQIKAIGLCGTDYELYTNEMVYIKEGLCKLPMIPGHEWSGVIVEVGSNVGDFKVGDKVTGECTISCGHCDFCKSGHHNMCTERTETGVMSRDGAFAEYITFPVSHLHKFSNISFEKAVIDTCRIIAEIKLHRRILRQKTFADQCVRVDQIEIARSRRKALIRRIAESRRTERQNLPVRLS